MPALCHRCGAQPILHAAAASLYVHVGRLPSLVPEKEQAEPITPQHRWHTRSSAARNEGCFHHRPSHDHPDTLAIRAAAKDFFLGLPPDDGRPETTKPPRLLRTRRTIDDRRIANHRALGHHARSPARVEIEAQPVDHKTAPRIVFDLPRGAFEIQP